MAYADFLKPLAQELAADPLGRGYAGMTDAQVAADLNEPRYTERVTGDAARFTDRTLADLWGTARTAEVLSALDAQAATDPEIALVLKLVRDVAGGGVDAGAPATQAMLDRFVASGLITQAEADQVRALGQRTVSRAEQLGYRDGVTEAWVRAVRGG